MPKSHIVRHPVNEAHRGVRHALLALLFALAVQIPTSASAQSTPVFLPLVRAGWSQDVFAGRSQAEAQQLYTEYFLPHTVVSAGWTGDHASCDAGQLSPAFTAATLKLLNYYRLAAGVTPVTFDATLSAKSEQAALMFSVNNALSHEPPPSWKCYTNAAAEAAGHSNISLFWDGGSESEAAGIRGQMEDPGANNTAVGHRRWILRPATQVMGMGHVPSGDGSTMASGVIWVLPPGPWVDPPDLTPAYIAWPPPGYIPLQALYSMDPYWYAQEPDAYRLRWLFQMQDAHFDSASISVSLDGAAVAVKRLPDVDESGEAAVFVPAIDYAQLAGDGEHAITVTVRSVVDAQGVMQDFSYTVHVFTASGS